MESTVMASGLRVNHSRGTVDSVRYVLAHATESGTVAGLRAIALEKHRDAMSNARWLVRREGLCLREMLRAQACRALEHAAAARFVYANAERIHAGAL